MTSMSNTGFGQYPGEPGPGGAYEQRTSVMAILSLVCALICFIPGLAVLGVLFGIASLVAISQSGERVTGRGLAIAGLIISLVVLAVQAGIFVGAGKLWTVFNTGMMQPSSQMMVDIEQGDVAAVRKVLSPEASKRISDADIAAFRDAYQAELGHFVGVPKTVMALVGDYSELGNQIQQFSGRNDALPPIPGTFDNGKAVLVFQFDPGSTGPGSNGQIFPPIVNVMILSSKGSKWTLYDPQRSGGAAPGGKPVQPPDVKPGVTKPADTAPSEPVPGDSGTPNEPGKGPG